MRKAKEAIAIAQKRGSTAKTVRGAVRFIQANPRMDEHLAEGLAYVDYISSEPGTVPHACQQKSTMLRITHEDRYESWCVQKGKWGPRAAEEYADALNADICSSIETDIFNSYPFRRSRSRWAGGELVVRVRIGAEPYASAGSDRVWSHNGKWPGTNTDASFTFTIRALSFFPLGRARGGEIILDAERVAPRVYEVTVPKQGAGQSVHTACGYLIRDHFIESKWSDAALLRAQTKARRARQASLSTLLSQRGKLREYRKIFVSREDSISAGNCATQTDEVAQALFTRLGARECAVRADVLIAYRNDSFVRRAIAKAMQHTL